MFWWFGKRKPERSPEEIAREAERTVSGKYERFQEILNLNTECLELIAGLQEDLQYIPPRRDVVEDRVSAIFGHTQRVIEALHQLSGHRYEALRKVVEEQQYAVGRYIATLQESDHRRLAVSLGEVGLAEISEVGGKAAYLGEVMNKLRLPVPAGFVLTTEAYRQFCGIPLWESIRDAIRTINLDDLTTVRAASRKLREMVLRCPMPRAVEVALQDRAARLNTFGAGFAVRSSAVGEGGERSYAGQFLSLLNIPPADLVHACRKVIAARFSERALSYRISAAVFEVESPMAILVLPVVPAEASGIMYTRDPSQPGSRNLWITATRGLGLDIASGQTPADLFVVSRKSPHQIRESHPVSKERQIVLRAGGGIERLPLDAGAAGRPSLTAEQVAMLAEFGLTIEKHFGSAQDVEWAIDQEGRPWILQSRPLALAQQPGARARSRPKGDPLLAGGQSIYPGRVSGPAYLAESMTELRHTPEGAIVFLRNASPEAVQIFPRVSGLAAETGNVAGHAAALLREFKIPSVFMMKGLFDAVKTGDPVSLDAISQKLYPGTLWEGREIYQDEAGLERKTADDPVSSNILKLNLIDPSSAGFRAASCKSIHDVLRFCHEKSVEAMFAVNDAEMERAGYVAKEIKTDVPLNICVLDLGGGLHPESAAEKVIDPSRITCRPFQSLWKGVTHPGVSWRREIQPSLGDLASVMASSFMPKTYQMRSLGMKSYLLVAGDYCNLNSRLAYHYSLVDACLCDDAIRNYVSFRFAGGGATRYRRSLRACFLEACLNRYGFLVQRRGDLVNAWLRKIPPDEADWALDILGRLMACTSQLDMYMSNRETMNWFVEQFLEGNYAFTEPPGAG